MARKEKRRIIELGGHMNILTKIKEWIGNQSVYGIKEFTRYKLIITLVDGEVIECYPNEYHEGLNSFAGYYMSRHKDGVNISGTFYPIHMIKCVDDEPLSDTELVCMEHEFSGMWGVDYESIKQNQEKWKHLIDDYKIKHEFQEG